MWAIGSAVFLQNSISFIREGGDTSESIDRLADKFQKDVEGLVWGEIKPILILASFPAAIIIFLLILWAWSNR